MPQLAEVDPETFAKDTRPQGKASGILKLLHEVLNSRKEELLISKIIEHGGRNQVLQRGKYLDLAGGCARKLYAHPPKWPASRRVDSNVRRNPCTRPAGRSQRWSCSGFEQATTRKLRVIGPGDARPTAESLSAGRSGAYVRLRTSMAAPRFPR